MHRISPFARGAALQEMDGKDCEGRYLGVKLDRYSNPSSRGVGQEDMNMGRSPSRARPSRHSASRKGRQVRSAPKPVFVLAELKL